MYGISPEDRLRMVTRDQDGLRQQMARERLAAAAPATRGIERSGARSAGSTRSHHAWMTAGHLLHVLTGRHAVARHGAAR